jgi:uncharacterized protein (DUF1778 family)
MQSITIRFPDEVVARAREESEAEGASVNQFVVDAVSEAAQRRRAYRALARSKERLARMTAAGQISPPSEPMLRELREGTGRRG